MLLELPQPSCTVWPRRFHSQGFVLSLESSLVIASLPGAAIGDYCTVESRGGGLCGAEVVGFRGAAALLAPYDEVSGVRPQAPVRSRGKALTLSPRSCQLGSIIDPLGRPLNSTSSPGTMALSAAPPVFASPPAPLERSAQSSIMPTGIRALDTLLTIGTGQRLGLIAGPGCGKSTLLGMIARRSAAAVNIIALVGERGRELREFIDLHLGPEGLARSIVVISTSSDSPGRRRLAAFTATALAEHFRNQGQRVLLLVDSLTRMARAIRELSLAAGEVPVQGGWTPSVFSQLPRLIERSGATQRGSITAIYSLLSNSGADDPLAQELKSLMDGHLILTPELAQQGVWPCLDPTQSVSRLQRRLLDPAWIKDRDCVVRALQRWREDRDLQALGPIADPELKTALTAFPAICRFLSQEQEEKIPLEAARRQLRELAATISS